MASGVDYIIYDLQSNCDTVNVVLHPWLIGM